MNCHRVVNLMSAYVDGELTGEEMLAIRRHMSTCSECAAEHESVLGVKKAVANLAAARPKADFVESILSRLDVVTVPSHQRFADWLISTLREKVSPVAAALAVSGLALVVMSAGEVETVAPAVGINAASVPTQQVRFLRDMYSDNVSLGMSQPVRLAEEIPGMGSARVQLASLTVQ